MPASILDDVIFPDALVAVAARGRKRWATAIATTASCGTPSGSAAAANRCSAIACATVCTMGQPLIAKLS